MDVEFLGPAKSELVEAIDVYNSESEGLGYRFAAEVRRAIELIIQYPEAWTPLQSELVRCQTNRFPTE